MKFESIILKFKYRFLKYFATRTPPPEIAFPQLILLWLYTWVIWVSLVLIQMIFMYYYFKEGSLSYFPIWFMICLFVIAPVNVFFCGFLWLLKLNCFMFQKKLYLVIEPLILLGMFSLPTEGLYLDFKWRLFQYLPSLFDFNPFASPNYQLIEPWYIWITYQAIPYILTAIVLIFIQILKNHGKENR